MKGHDGGGGVMGVRKGVLDVSFFSSDCLEQTRLLCKRHSSSRAHWSVLAWHLCDLHWWRQHTAFRKRQTCACIMCDVSEHNSVSTFSVSPSNGARLKRLKEVHESPLLVYSRTALYYCSAPSNDALLQMSLVWGAACLNCITKQIKRFILLW